MKILRAYKTELDPNGKQETMFRKCAGTARFIYNWGLAEWEDWYASGGNPSAYSIRRYLNSFKRSEYPWMNEIPYAVVESAVGNLGNAFKRYFREKKDGAVASNIARLKQQGKWKRRVSRLLEKGRYGYQLDPGYPQFKKKGRDDSFQLKNTKVEHDRVRLTHIGWVRLKERGYIPVNGTKYGVYATVSRRAGRWFISVLVEEEIPDLQNKSILALGVDFGLKALAVCSDGTVFENPHALQQEERKLKRLGRELSKRKKGGQNWKKTKRKMQRCHARIANIRKHALHRVSHHVTAKTKPKTVVLEDLNVKGMLQNRRLSKAIADVGWAELRRQIEYKAEWYGSDVLIAPGFYPSSRLCRACGVINQNLTLADRSWTCECGEYHDRDLYAAENLAALAEGRNTPGLPVELG